MSVPLIVALALTVGAPAGAVKPGGEFPLDWLWARWQAGPAWSAEVPGVPRQPSGTAEGKDHYVDADATEADGGRGRMPKPAPGTLPAYEPHDPGTGPETTAPARVGFDEQTSQRVAGKATAESDVYRNADGSYTRKVYDSPVNYLAADGTWRPIDVDLQRRSDGRLHMSANSLKISVAGAPARAAAGSRTAGSRTAGSRTAGARTTAAERAAQPATAPPAELAAMTLPTGQTVAYRLDGAAAVAPVVSGGTATYRDILPGTDLELSTFHAGLKETLILRSPDAPSSWMFPLRLDGLTPRMADNGSVELVDASGKVAAWFPRGFMEDSNVDPKSGAPEQSSNVDFELTTTVEGAPALKVTADQRWLRDPARIFPVKVDPTTTTGTTGDVFIDTNSATTNHNGDNLPVGTYNGGTVKARSFIHLDNFDENGLTGKRITAAKLRLYHTWSYDCNTHLPIYVHRVNEPWTVAGLTSAAPSAFPGPAISSAIGSLTISDNYPACTNDEAVRSVGKWWTVPLPVATFNDWSSGGLNQGLALTASESDSYGWKRFTSANFSDGSYKPYLELTYADNVAPQIDVRYPANNAVIPTLTPELLVRAHDPDAYPAKGLTYQFAVYDAAGAAVASSPWQSATSWTVPAEKLAWNKSYLYTVRVYDKVGYSAVYPAYAFTTSVPQPMLTGSLAQNADKGFDPSVGNYTTSAVDASVASPGPALEVTRSYNSLDIRRDQAFGTGWSSIVDTRATQVKEVNGSVQSVNVSYPSGQEVAFGRNANGTFTPPPGRFATFVETKDTAGALTGYTLTDKDGTGYAFGRSGGSGVFKITTITDANGRALTFSYDSAGLLTKMTSSASGRSLHFTWTRPDTSWVSHVASVYTDPVVADDWDTALTWKYEYTTHDRLTGVCPPTDWAKCVTYAYGGWASPHANAVLNAGPSSYWRLNEPSGTIANSYVLANAGTDNARYSGVTLGQAAAMPNSSSTSAAFNGTSSFVQLPGGLVSDGQYQSVSLWFKTTAANGVLFSYQADPVSKGTTTGNYTPSLYVDKNGYLRGEFWQGSATGAMKSTKVVNDGAWHHAVLAGAGDTQTMYLDGAAQATLAGTISLYKATGAAYAYVGAGFVGGTWPDHANTARDGNVGFATYFNGSISDVAFFNQGLTASAVGTLYSAAANSHPLLTQVNRASGARTALVAYSTVTGKVTSVTDENGGTWSLGAPVVTGSSAVYSASVLGAKPQNYWRLADTEVTDAVNEVQGGTATYGSVTLGAAGPFPDATAASFDGTAASVALPGDVAPGGANSVELWFNTTGTNGVLLGSQAGELGTTTAPGLPTMWVGADGKLRALSPSTTPTGPLTSAGIAGKCVDVASSGTANGTKIQLFTCNGTSAQNWTVHPDGSVRALGKCMEVTGGGTANGTKIQLFDCNASTRQVWEPYNGGLRNPQSGKCLDDPGSSTTNGTQLQIYTCNGSGAQRWTLSLSTSAAVNDGKWHHAVLTSSGTTQTLYVDGVKAQSSTGAATLTPGDQPYAYLGAGYTGTGWSNLTAGATVYYKGGLAETAFYGAELTADQVAAHFQASKQSAPVAITIVDGVAKQIPMPVSTVTVTGPTGEQQSYTYDLVNGARPVAHTDPLGNVTRFGYDVGGYSSISFDPRGVWTQNLQDARGNTKQTITCQDQAANKCSSVHYTYYPDATTTTLTPDPRNDVLLTMRDGRSASATDNTYLTSYGYDARGNRTTVTDPLGRVTTTAYTDGTTVAAADGGYAPAGLPMTVTTPGGAMQTVAYYANGDLASVTDPAGKVVRYTYDNLGRVLTETEVTDSFPNGLTTRYGYDALGRVLTKTEPPVTNRVTGAVHTAVTTTVYDADGQTLSQTVSDTTGGDAARTESSTYNSLGQQVAETDELGDTTSYEYDAHGRVVAETGPDGRTVRNAYDAEGNLLTTTLVGYTGSPNNPTDPTDVVLSSNAYDPAGRLAAETDSMGYVTKYTYTDNGLTAKVTRTDPATGAAFVVEENTYDAAGNVVTQVTNNGASTSTYTVDAVGRTTGSTLDPGGLARTSRFTYSADDYVTAVTSSDASGTLAVRDTLYDRLGEELASTTYNGDPATTPVGRWRLNDGGGTRAADSSGNSAGTATNTTWTTERGGAAKFNGTAASRIATGGPVLDTTRSYTVSAWVNLASLPADNRAAVSQDGDIRSGFLLGYNGSTSRWRMLVSKTSTVSASVLSTDIAAANAWTHLAGVYDDATKTVTLYVNGVAQGSVAVERALAAHGPLVIGGGRWSGTPVDAWPGQASDVQVYQRALSGTQVANVYAGTAPAAGAHVVRNSSTLDQDGLVTASTDANGNVTNYEYDEAGQPTVTVEPTTTVELPDGNTVPSRSVSYVGYDTFGAPVEAKDARGNVTVTEYDAAGRVVATRLPAYTAPGSTEPINAVTRATYDSLGQILTQTDPLGAITRYTYDQLGQPAKVTAPDGGVTTYEYDLNGRVLGSTDPAGSRSTATYDFLGRQATTTDVVRQTGAAHTASYRYNDAGWISSVTTPAGATSSTEYNAAGEVVTETDGAGSVTRVTYDGLGRAVRTTLADGTYSTVAYDQAGRPTSNASYDAAGTLLSRTSTTYDPAGNALSSTDPRGTTTRFTYDATGLLTSQVEPISASDSITTSFGYDVAGQLTRMTDGRGNTFRTTYNAWGLPEAQIEPATSAYPDPADRTFSVAYDAAGQAVRMISPGGVTVTNSYDTAGNLVGQVGSGAEVATTNRAYEYDQAGRMVSATGSAGAITFGYDDRGLLTSVDGVAGASSFAYNGDGNMTSRTDVAGTTSYVYDGAGRVATVSNPQAGVSATYTYNSLSMVKTVGYGAGGNTRTLRYDGLKRLTVDEVTTPDGASVAKIEYGFDANGNEISKKTTGFAGSATNTYTYDLADRLTSWNNGTTTTAYAYDKSGNRVQNGARTFTYDARNQLLTQTDGSAVTTYAYTPRGTLSAAATGSATLETKADAFNQVLAQDSSSAGRRTYAYDGLGRVIRPNFAYSGTGNTLAGDGAATYVRDAGDDLFAVRNAGDTRLAWTDLHDDVVGQFAGTGTTLAGSATYDPLGKVLAAAGMWGSLGYQSEWTDEFTGRVNMMARWYNTDTGQFDTRDTTAVSAVPNSVAANRFAYGDENPLTTTDPTGHWGMPSFVKKAVSTVSRAVSTVSSYASTAYRYSYSAYSYASSYTSRAYNAAKTTVKKAASTVKRSVKRVYRAAKRTVQRTYHAVKKVAKKAYKAVKKAVNKGRKWVADKAHKLKQKVKKAVNKIKQAGKKALAKATRVVKKAASKVKDAAKATGKWIKEHKDTIIEVAAIGAGILAGVACTAATAGAGAVACMVGAAALVNVAKDYAQGDIHSVGDLLTSAGTGALQGALGFAGGAIGGRVAAYAAGKLGGLAASIGGRMATGGLSAGVEDAVTQFATTGRVDLTGVAMSAGMGALSGGRGRGSRVSPGAATKGAGTPDAVPGRRSSDGGSGGSCPVRRPGVRHSFKPDTMVQMADGSTRPIKDVNVGDKVTATDPKTGATTARPVTMLHINTDNDLTNVTVKITDPARAGPRSKPATGKAKSSRVKGKLAKLAATAAVAASLAAGASTVLHTTAHHPFWDDTTGRWVNAAELTVGHELHTLDGKAATVTAVRSFTGAQDMRDLTVGADHTYYVIAGDSPVLVHNNNMCGTASTQAVNHIDWAREGGGPYANAARQRAFDYESRTPGARTDPLTGQNLVPRLSMPAADGGNVTAKFDGLLGDELIDRKNNVLPFTTDSMIDEARRQAATSAYHGLQAVWEVPNAAVMAKAQRWLSDASVTNINVRVAP